MNRFAVAVIVAGGVAFAITAAPAAFNRATIGDRAQQAVPQLFAKADRLRVRGEARAVRIIALR